MTPLLSIIIPVYNVEKYLSRCLQSIVEQTFKEFEVILINDGSKDNSKEICEEFCLHDSRFKLINQENKGAGCARNKGIKNAIGKYLCFIDADDWIEPHYLETIINASEDFDIVFWGYTIETPTKKEEHTLSPCTCWQADDCIKSIYDLKKKYEYGFTVTCLLKTNFIQQFNILFPTNIQLHEDIVFINNYCSHIKTLRIIDLTGYHYMKYSDTSLSRRFIPYEEAYNIASEVFHSSIHWHKYKPLYDFELTNYMNWLTLSVVNMYQAQNQYPNFHTRIQQIKRILQKIYEYHYDLSNLSNNRKYIFQLQNAYLIDICYRLIKLLKH